MLSKRSTLHEGIQLCNDLRSNQRLLGKRLPTFNHLLNDRYDRLHLNCITLYICHFQQNGNLKMAVSGISGLNLMAMARHRPQLEAAGKFFANF